MRIGFIGLGIMGKPMALHLRQGGHELWVYGRRRVTMEPLMAAGATGCSNPAEVAANADIIFVMVSDTPDVEQVLFGADGVAEGMRAGSVVVDMSSISPVTTKDMARRLVQKGVDMIDAPVSGGEVGAVNATLSIMAGGKPEVFERVKPLFELMGKNIVRVGDSGAGQTAKVCNQVVVAMTIIAVSEALLLATKAGVNPARVREALLGGFAGSKILEVHGNRMITRDFKPGFKTALHQKDMKIAMQTAHDLGLALPGAAMAAEYLNALMGTGDGELDSSAIVKVLERMSNMEVRGEG
jgi:2-hydroxy-3-oxopropionate reductase